VIQSPPLPRLLPALLATVALVLAACGGGGDDKDEAEQTVRDFVKATNDRDTETFCGELASQEFLEQSTGAKGDQAQEECRRQLEAIQGLEVELVRIRETKIDGDRATVTAVIESQGAPTPQTLRLVKEDGDWKLAGGSGGR
jgi:Domain of unknown function (DUF4878)